MYISTNKVKYSFFILLLFVSLHVIASDKPTAISETSRYGHKDLRQKLHNDSKIDANKKNKLLETKTAQLQHLTTQSHQKRINKLEKDNKQLSVLQNNIKKLQLENKKLLTSQNRANIKRIDTLTEKNEELLISNSLLQQEIDLLQKKLEKKDVQLLANEKRLTNKYQNRIKELQTEKDTLRTNNTNQSHFIQILCAYINSSDAS